MGVSKDSINGSSIIELMHLDDHDAVFNPIHAKLLVKMAWTVIAFVFLAMGVAAHFIAVPAFELYTQSVPGASNAMLSLIIAGFVAIFVVDLAAGFIVRHGASAKLVKVTTS